MSDLSECVFVKYRDLIKFENFYMNDPAIYLPFVIYNWLTLSILPNLYINEGNSIEASRIELLQNETYLFEVLTLIINCVLDIKIELNYDLYKQNIEKLKKIKQFSISELYPLVTIEKYMSNEHSNLFLNSVSKYFPIGSLKQSTDAIPSYELYKIISNKVSGTAIWGSSYWVVLHYTTLVVDKMSKSKLKENYQESLCILTGFLDLLLPCSICRYHYSSLFKFNEEEDFNRPFQLILPIESLEYAKNNNLFEFYSLLHNNCKPMNQREELSMDQYKEQYEKFYKFRNK